MNVRNQIEEFHFLVKIFRIITIDSVRDTRVTRWRLRGNLAKGSQEKPASLRLFLLDQAVSGALDVHLTRYSNGRYISAIFYLHIFSIELACKPSSFLG